MALYRPGPILTDARGSIAGCTFSRNRSGLLIRQRVKPIDPNTPAQAQSRDRVRDLQYAWRSTLDATDRIGWSALADSVAGTNMLGSPIRLTAVNHFIAVNSLRLCQGAAILHVAPPPPATTQIPDLIFVGTTALGIKLTSITPISDPGDLIFIRMSDAHSVTRNFYKTPWPRFFHEAASITLPLSLIHPSEVVIGQRWFIQARYMSVLGRLSGYDNTILDIAT